MAGGVDGLRSCVNQAQGIAATMRPRYGSCTEGMLKSSIRAESSWKGDYLQRIERKISTRLLLFAFLVAISASGQMAPPTMAVHDPDMQAKVDAYLQPYLDGNNFSGAVFIAKKGKVVVSKGYGMANYELGVPNTPQIKFHIASVSKPFTATAIMILQEREFLSVNDPLTRFIPDYPNGDRITLHHLLTHTSGILNVNEFPDYDQKSKFPHTPGELVEMFKHKPLEFQPGERYSYSNSNYNLLAFIIEKVSRQGYGEFLKENIFAPLDMRNTGHDGRAAAILENRASGYVPAGASSLENAPYLDWSIKTGNGSLYSTVEDLSKFDRALYTEKILKKASLEKMFAESRGNSYGWFVRKRFSRKVTAANGRSPGFTASLERFVDDDVCVIVLSNTYSTVAQTPIAADLAAIVLTEKYAVPMAIRPVKVNPKILEAYVGRYEFGVDFFRPGAVVAIRRQDDHLLMDWGGGFQGALVPVSEAEFLDRNFWARVTFAKGQKGELAQLTWAADRDYKAKRLPDR